MVPSGYVVSQMDDDAVLLMIVLTARLQQNSDAILIQSTCWVKDDAALETARKEGVQHAILVSRHRSMLCSWHVYASYSCTVPAGKKGVPKKY